MVRYKWLLSLLPLLVGGCDLEALMGGGGGGQGLEEAQGLLRGGDLPGASAKFDELAVATPESVDVAIGRAYTQLLAGDTSGADATLAAVEAKAGEQLGAVKLRRALVALEVGDLDGVKSHGRASGLPEGKLFAAEVHLADLENDEAIATLKEVSASGGPAGVTANEYLALLESGDPYKAGMAEASALWALGDREGAVANVEELLDSLDDENKDALVLIWAGRAVTSGAPGVAGNLLEMIETPPQGQQWRIQSVRAMIAIADGDAETGLQLFEVLNGLADQGDVPREGLNDAMATAAALSGDPGVARQLVGSVESAAAARGLLEAGDGSAAKGQAPSGPLRSYLESL